jgi:MFS transporter, OPA family, sugar phosphate sensor protein UhpC
MYLVYGCFYLNRLNVAPVIPLIMVDLEISHTQVGLLTSFFFVSYTVSQFFTGYLSDIRGPRRVITFGGAVSVVANLSFSVGRKLCHLISAQALNGLGQGAGWGPSLKLINAWFPPETKGRTLGIYSTSISVFTILTYLLAGYLGKTFGWRVVFRVSPVVLMGVLFIFRMVVRDQPQGWRGADIPPGHLAPSEEIPESRNRYVTVISDRDFRLASAGFSCLLYISYTNLVWLPSYFYERHGLSLVRAALLTTLYPALGLLSRPLGGYLSDVTFGGRRRPLILIGFFFILFANLFLGVANHLGLTVGLVLCVGFFDQLMVTAFMALLLDMLPKELTGTGAGLFEAVGHVGTVCAMFFSGLLVDMFQSYKPMFLALSIMAFAGIVAMFGVLESRGMRLDRQGM